MPAAGGSPKVTGPRRAKDGESRLDLRRAQIFATAERHGAALEIGPAHNGILPKREGFDTKTVDYLDRAGLIDKYKAHDNYSPDDIEEVDFVLPPGAAMGDIIKTRFDLVLASHVLEHTTSLVDFLNECTRLLQPGGVIALVVPDHRFCFDRFRERSSLGSVIDAHLEPHEVHTVGTLTEFAVNAVKHRGTTSWAPVHAGRYSWVNGESDIDRIRRSATSGRYVDVHHWVFTPNHLRLLLHDLRTLGYIEVAEAHFHDTVGHEFFINLSRESQGPGLSREELVGLSDDELRSLDVPEWESGA
jgi:SAM-dependent methyltransferase